MTRADLLFMLAPMTFQLVFGVTVLVALAILRYRERKKWREMEEELPDYPSRRD